MVERSKDRSSHQKISHEIHKTRWKDIRKSHERENNLKIDKRKALVPSSQYVFLRTFCTIKLTILFIIIIGETKEVDKVNREIYRRS